MTAVGSSARHRTSPRTINRAVHHHRPVAPTNPTVQDNSGPDDPGTKLRIKDRTIINRTRAPTHTAPRPLLRMPPPGGRRHARRYTRCRAVVKDTAKATVI